MLERAPLLVEGWSPGKVSPFSVAIIKLELKSYYYATFFEK